jgi:hypothetical protein
MVSTFYQTLLVLFTVMAFCHAFSTPEIKSRGAARSCSSTELRMGLFDKPKPKKPAKGGSDAWLEGRGKRITIREDEDAAMWIDEPKPKKPAPKKGK